MTTREKVIVGVMCLTIFYGAYELIGSGGGGKKERVTASKANPLEELRGFVAEVTQKMVKEKMSEEYQYMVQRAGMDWVKDPFIRSSALLKEQATVQSPGASDMQSKAPAPDYAYTGYLELGAKRLAVINGMEYTAGESIGTRGYYIKSIAPNKVVIGNVDTLEVIQLKIQEEY